ncbi:MAG: carboxypeptidase-like regulatory domain-containing protein, partial [Saonia sp.]
MQIPILFAIFLLPFHSISAQNDYRVSGSVVDNLTKQAVLNCKLALEGVKVFANADENGVFNLNTLLSGDYILVVSAQDYLDKRIPITLENQSLDLGVIYLEKDISSEKTDNLIALTDSDLSNDETAFITSGLLQATRDVFLNRAAFDFGQAFFRVRGYGSENGSVLI